jgi:hypothetical protein
VVYCLVWLLVPAYLESQQTQHVHILASSYHWSVVWLASLVIGAYYTAEIQLLRVELKDPLWIVDETWLTRSGAVCWCVRLLGLLAVRWSMMYWSYKQLLILWLSTLFMTSAAYRGLYQPPPSGGTALLFKVELTTYTSMLVLAVFEVAVYYALLAIESGIAAVLG